MSVYLKRVYEKPIKEDGFRVLVERLWPRGVSKHNARVDLWLKEAAPSPALRTWFNHDPAKWEEFKARYFTELAQQEDILSAMMTRARKETVTFVYASKEERFNNAVALKEYFERQARRKSL